MNNIITVEFLKDFLTGEVIENGAIDLQLSVGAPGATGKGAYELAADAGYKGTKETFVSALSEIGAIEDLLAKI